MCGGGGRAHSLPGGCGARGGVVAGKCEEKGGLGEALILPAMHVMLCGSLLPAGAQAMSLKCSFPKG